MEFYQSDSQKEEKMKKRAGFWGRLAVLALVPILSVLVMSGVSQAGNNCALCHGMPPGDTVPGGGRDQITGKLQGNHETHMKTGQSTAPGGAPDCNKCHTGAKGLTTQYSTSHAYRNSSNGVYQIQLGYNNINASALGQYSVAGKARTFLNQTSIPLSSSFAGTCSNVNCHFNKKTDAWGQTAAYSTPPTTASCSKCHNNGASTTDAGPGGQHPSAATKHGAYYGSGVTATLTSCALCHQDYTATNPTKPFQHATSVLHATISVQFKTFVNLSSTTTPQYTGNATTLRTGYPNFLTPDSSAGNCNNIYCHSDGTTRQGTVNNNPSVNWSIGSTQGCSGCHKNTGSTGATSTSAISTNAHDMHVSSDKYNYGCVKCHSSTVDKTNITILTPNGGKHVNRSVEVSFNNTTTAATTGRYNAQAALRPSVATNRVGNAVAGRAACTNIYCHSDGTAAVNTATYTPMSTAKWGPANTMLPTGGVGGNRKCSSCHGGDSTQPSGRVMATGSHTKHIASGITGGKKNYKFLCVECHSNTVTNNTNNITLSGYANHVNHQVEVTGGTNLGAYSVPAKQPGSTAGTCGSSYCHSNGITPSGTYATPVWSGTAACGSCHGADSTNPPTSSSHLKHVGTAAGYQYECATCHVRVVQPSGAPGNASVQPAISSANLHVTGNHDVQFRLTKTINAGTYTTPACSNIYCHSEGKSNTGTFTAISTARWNATPGKMNCNDCHGFPPSYTTGKANSHSQHSQYGCNNCHYTVTTNGATIPAASAPLHANQAYNIKPDAAQNPQFTNPVTGSPAGLITTCAGISCHGGVTSANATWGTNTLKCEDCHGGTAVTAAESYVVGVLGANFWDNNVLNVKIDMAAFSATGHGLATTSNYPGTSNKGAGFTASGQPQCEFCHVLNSVTDKHKDANNPFRLKNQSDPTWGRNGVCMSCHALGSAGVNGTNATQTKIGSIHYGAMHKDINGFKDPTKGGKFCWDCHNGHGTSNHAMIRTTVSKTTDGVIGIPVIANQMPVTFIKTGAANDYKSTNTSICTACHTTTKYYTYAVPSNAHNSTAVCTTCHQHTSTGSINNAFEGGGCNNCHGYPPVPRNATTAASKGTTWAKQGIYSAARFEDYSGGGGMHIIPAHVSPNAQITDGFSQCTNCHAGQEADHTLVDGNVRTDISKVTVKVPSRLRFNKDSQVSYSGAKLQGTGSTNKAGKCFNVSCHFQISPRWSTVRP
jgi:predicted CxxxxCH...CXXCH cytochrome family protein